MWASVAPPGALWQRRQDAARAPRTRTPIRRCGNSSTRARSALTATCPSQPATWIEMSFFKKQPEYLDRQANASKAREALLEKFRSKTESEEDFAKRQAALMEIRVAREAREAERKAAAAAAHEAELLQQAAMKAEEEERARVLEAEQK